MRHGELLHGGLGSFGGGAGRGARADGNGPCRSLSAGTLTAEPMPGVGTAGDGQGPPA
ncbi:hypothetical protein FM106_23255 [Brachybacterium faecium]|nr:hypothetical protein FM106_23255 [Brachybacterium faecium]